MSLVNDMLRDLNRRTPVSNQAARVHGAIQSSIESKRPKMRTGLILAGGLLAGLAGGYIYFESMGVQVVPIPLAATPRQTSPQPVVQNSPAVVTPVAPAGTSAETAAPVAVVANLPAVETLVEIRELATQPNGFTLLLEVSQLTTFDIRDRTAFGLTLHIDDVDEYDRSGTIVPGMSLLLVSDGLDLGLELEKPADFLVREDSETPAFDILITASYRPDEDLTATDVSAPQQPPVTEAAPPIAVASNSLVPQSGIEPAQGERSSPVRVTRELSLEDRDSNNSQQALMLVQGGRMTEAYQQLLTFLDENPAAHQSRETFAKLLFAQQEYSQAGVIVDQGLAEIPNYAPFKKIKARLLMQGGDPAQALGLLRNVPPAVAEDTEYHELLASAYQQSSNHQQAVSSYQSLLRIDRTQGRWWAGLGISLEAQDMDSDALVSFQTALQTTNLDAGLRQYIQNRIGNLRNPQ